MLTETPKGTILAVKITPKASRSALVGVEGEELKLRIAALPEKGKANAELVRFLSKILDIPKSRITILSGETSRHKKLLLSNIPLSDCKDKIYTLLT